MFICKTCLSPQYFLIKNHFKSNINIDLFCKNNHKSNLNLDNNFNFNFNFDNSCSNHKDIFISYCNKCKQNLCKYCIYFDNMHEDHEIIDYNIIINKKEISKKKEEVKNIIKFVEEIKYIVENILNKINVEIFKLKNKLDMFLNSFKIEKNLINCLLNFYNNNLLNLETIINIKNIINLNYYELPLISNKNIYEQLLYLNVWLENKFFIKNSEDKIINFSNLLNQYNIRYLNKGKYIYINKIFYKGYNYNIYKGKEKKTKKKIIIKKIKTTNIINENNLREEIKKIQSYNFRTILNINDFFEINNYLFIIQDYYKINLKKFLYNKKQLNILQIRNLINKINKILKRFFDIKLNINNIKLDNIFIKQLSNNLILNNIEIILNPLNLKNYIKKDEIIENNIFKDIGFILYKLYFNEYPIYKNNQIILKNSKNILFQDLLKLLIIDSQKNLINFDIYFSHSFFKFNIQDETTLYNNYHIMTTLKYHTFSVNSLLILSDGRIASASYDKTIKIYNKYTYILEINIVENNDNILYLIQSKDNILISCSFQIINFFQINKSNYFLKQSINAHNKWVYKIIQLTNYQLVSCSDDGFIKFWEKNVELYININNYNLNEYIYNILEINNNIIFTTTYLNIFSLKSNTISYNFKNIQCSEWNNNLCLINQNILIIGGIKKLYIFNLNNFILLNEFDYNNDILSIIKINNNVFLIGDSDGNISKFEYEDYDIILINNINKAHNNYINSIVKYKNFIITCSYDESIKFWS